MREILKLFLTFLKIGAFTFGGGYAMIPAIRREVVTVRAWIGESEMTDCIAISQSLPGVFAVNASVYIGKRVAGVPGSLAACFGVILPAFLPIVLILMFLGKISDNAYINGAFEGIKAASVALILVTAWQMGRKALRGKTGILVGAAAFALIILLEVSAVLAIAFGGVAGYLEYRYRNRKKADAEGGVRRESEKEPQKEREEEK